MLFMMVFASAVFVLFGAQPTMADYIVAPGGYWKLDEADPGASGSPADATSGGADGTCSSTTDCAAAVSGQIQGAYDFNETTNNQPKVDIAEPDISYEVFDFGGTTDASFSIELWMKLGTLPGENAVMIGRVSGNTIWWIGVNTGGTIGCQFRDSAGTDDGQFDGSIDVVSDSDWHHVVVVRDGAEGKISLYVDGVFDKSWDSTANADFTGSDPLTLGYLDIGGLYYYNGLLDNVAIYPTTALSGDQVMQNYLGGDQGKALEDEFGATFSGSASETIAFGFEALLPEPQPAGNPMTFTFSSSNLPDGATIDPTTGVVTWLPTDLQLGSNQYAISATNGVGSAASQDWTVTVEDLCVTAIDVYLQLEGDPTSGTADSQGSIADGTCSGDACPASASGRIGNGYDFDGTNDEVVFADSGDDGVFDFYGTPVSPGDPEGFSIELWMRLDDASTSAGQREVMIGRYDNSDSYWWIGVDTADNGGDIIGNIVCNFNDSDATDPATVPDIEGDPGVVSDVVDDAWHHVVVVRDGVADTLAIYVDGELEKLDIQTGDDTSTDGRFESAEDVILGNLGIGSFFFNGLLDEVAIYNRPLSATIIAQHANAATDQGYCNQAPTIDSTEVTTATEDIAYSYSATATDPEGHAITWSLTTAPAGMTIDSSTGAVAWTPGEGVTSEAVVILATDEFGATDNQSFTIAVTAVNDAPVITAQATLETDEGTDLTITLADLTVTDPDNTYPADFSLAVQSGTNYTVSGATITPDAGFSGDLTVPVTVNDGVADSNVFNLTVTVGDGGSSGGGGGGGGSGCFISTVDF
jgi:hypothetical protein